MVYVLTIAALLVIGTAAAAPVLPDEFYGTVYLNGNPAPAGTVIVAKINGEPRGELTTTVAGVYGGPGNFDPRLVVTSTEDEVTSGNVSITFFVAEVQAFQIVNFKSGNSEKLDLIANSKAFGTGVTTSPTTYVVSGGYSGSSGGAGGYVSGGSSSGVSITGSTVTPAITIPSTVPINQTNTASRSSIYQNIDATPTTEAPMVAPTTELTRPPAVTTVVATTKAGPGFLSVILLVASIIIILNIAGRFGVNKEE